MLQKRNPWLSPLDPRQSFYKSLIQPIIDYACVIWGATSQHNLHRILRLQKYAARVILNIKRPQDVPSSELFSKLNWMTINQRIDYFTSIMMYKTINKSSPNYLRNRFEYVKDKHQINTRFVANRNLFIHLSYLLRQDKGLFSTGEYMLGTVYLGALDTIA